MIVRPLFYARTNEGSTETEVLLTFAVPKRDEGYYCHACAPTVGMAVFTKHESGWTLTAVNRAMIDAGSFGKPPNDIELIQIGSNHKAVQIKDTETGGEKTTVLLILVPWNGTVNVALERIIGDDDEAMCGPKDLPCYSNRRTFTFSANPDSDYYDLKLRLVGTDLPASDRPKAWTARKVSGLEILKFQNGKYTQVSRSGDLTTVDRVVAEREGLK